MADTNLAEEIRQIKSQLRLMMNGKASMSMREKGLNYRMNFGVELPRLREFADTLPHSANIAIALWKEDIRECRILAGMLMPAEECSAELAELWIEQMRFLEEAEHTVMNLFCNTDWASEKMFPWIASENEMFRICGFLLASRLFMRGMTLSPRDEQEYLDQSTTALRDKLPNVAHASQKSLLKYMALGEEQEKAVEKNLQQL